MAAPREAGAIDPMVRLLAADFSAEREQAAGALRNLAVNGKLEPAALKEHSLALVQRLGDVDSWVRLAAVSRCAFPGLSPGFLARLLAAYSGEQFALVGIPRVRRARRS